MNGLEKKANGDVSSPPVTPKDSHKGGGVEEDPDCEGASDDGSRRENEDEDGDDPSKDDVDWEECYCCPLHVRFTQEKIHPFFYRRGPIVNVLPKIRVIQRSEGCQDVIGIPKHHGDEISELVPPFGPITCLHKGDEMWSLDNRRLYALQLMAMEQWPMRCCVKILCSDRLPRRKLKTQWRKFQTTCEGRAIIVSARFQQFDTWSWFDRATELEWYTLSLRLGFLLNVFELLPVAGALLFRTGLTGFRSRVPFVVGFLTAIGIDFLRCKVPIFERRISELHVKAIMESEVRPLSPCPRRTEDEPVATTSSSQMAALAAVLVVLLLPYIAAMNSEKWRSSAFSCWLGVAVVLFVQFGVIMRTKRSAEIEYSGTNRKLTPKHRS